MTLTDFLEIAQPFAIPAGVAIAAIHMWLRHGHYRQCCPATVDYFVRPQPTECTCRCRLCKSGRHDEVAARLRRKGLLGITRSSESATRSETP